MISTPGESPQTPAAEWMRSFYDGVMARPFKRKCYPNPPELEEMNGLPSCINDMEPHSFDDLNVFEYGHPRQ